VIKATEISASILHGIGDIITVFILLFKTRYYESVVLYIRILDIIHQSNKIIWNLIASAQSMGAHGSLVVKALDYKP
jgi:hypothetical protein